MEKYKIVLVFKNGSDIESIELDKKPTYEEAEEGMRLYKADGLRIETITA
jgi:hypothetical protein